MNLTNSETCVVLFMSQDLSAVIDKAISDPPYDVYLY